MWLIKVCKWRRSTFYRLNLDLVADTVITTCKTRNKHDCVGSSLNSIGCDVFVWPKDSICFSFSLYSSVGPFSSAIFPKDWHVPKKRVSTHASHFGVNYNFTPEILLQSDQSPFSSLTLTPHSRFLAPRASGELKTLLCSWPSTFLATHLKRGGSSSIF